MKILGGLFMSVLGTCPTSAHTWTYHVSYITVGPVTMSVAHIKQLKN